MAIATWNLSTSDVVKFTSTTTDYGSYKIMVVAPDYESIKDAIEKLQAAATPYAAPPLTERQLDIFPAVLELDVTREDIFTGHRGDATGCAVAKALARRFDGATVTVHNHEIRVVDPETSALVIYRPPMELAYFIHNFDEGYPVTSTRFSLVRVNQPYEVQP